MTDDPIAFEISVRVIASPDLTRDHLMNVMIDALRPYMSTDLTVRPVVMTPEEAELAAEADRLMQLLSEQQQARRPDLRPIPDTPGEESADDSVDG